ncbi:MAG: hypothetical protein ACREBU_14650, partial [Nitrososphaera sp.]
IFHGLEVLFSKGLPPWGALSRLICNAGAMSVQELVRLGQKITWQLGSVNTRYRLLTYGPQIQSGHWRQNPTDSSVWGIPQGSVTA